MDCQCCTWRLAVTIVEGRNVCHACAFMIEDLMRFRERIERETGCPINKEDYLNELFARATGCAPRNEPSASDFVRVPEKSD